MISCDLLTRQSRCQFVGTSGLDWARFDNRVSAKDREKKMKNDQKSHRKKRKVSAEQSLRHILYFSFPLLSCNMFVLNISFTHHLTMMMIQCHKHHILQQIITFFQLITTLFITLHRMPFHLKWLTAFVLDRIFGRPTRHHAKLQITEFAQHARESIVFVNFVQGARCAQCSRVCIVEFLIFWKIVRVASPTLQNEDKNDVVDN